MDKQLAIKSKLMKFEAVALFAGVRAEIESERWQYFREARKQDFPYSLAQNISAYRASLNFTYVYQDISTIVYLEREAHIGKPGENLWTLSFSCIEGKTQALVIANALSELKEKGYYIPNGNENLERQMNFSPPKEANGLTLKHLKKAGYGYEEQLAIGMAFNAFLKDIKAQAKAEDMLICDYVEERVRIDYRAIMGYLKEGFKALNINPDKHFKPKKPNQNFLSR